MAGRREKKGERIDLGLEALLSHSSTTNDHQDSGVSPAAPEHKDVWTLGASSSTEKSEYETLANNQKWSEIVRRAESVLALGDEIEAKVWWVRGHLGAFSMPVSFLAAPLNLVLRSVKQGDMDQSLALIIRETGLLALSRLREVNDSAQFEEMKSALERLGIYEPKNPRERRRTGTSSFRPADILNHEKALEGVSGGDNSKEGLSLRALLLLSVSVVLVLGAGVTAYFGRGLFTSPLKTAREGFVSGPIPLEQVVNIPGPKDPGGRLGALFYSIDGQKEETPPAPTQVSVAVEPPTQDVPVVADKGGGREPALQNKKERINTSEPQEGPEFRDRRDRKKERDLKSDRAGREAPRAALPSEREGVFTNEHTYAVLSRTPVLSAPSFGGKEIGYLERGDRVLVEGKLGRWLRLRSRKGRGGYVLSEDVEEIPDDELAPMRGR